MSRPIIEVNIGGRKYNALLDTGSRRSYIRSEVAKNFQVVAVQPFHAKIGGRKLSFHEGRLVLGIIKDSEGREYKFGNILYPMIGLGTEATKRIDMLFGALLLEDWGAIIDESSIPPKIDFQLLREGELIEL